MSDFIILTDSSADLNAEMAAEIDVQVLPLTFTIQEKNYYNYPDNRDMAPETLYRLLREGQVATTAAVNLSQYIEQLEPQLQDGKDVLILSFSSGLSATYQSSRLAADELSEKYPARKIYAVDTLCASLGQGLLIWMAAQQRKNGAAIQAVRDWVEENKLRIGHLFTVDDLQFLRRGGRISSSTAVVGSMLQIKPVLCVNSEGQLVNIAKSRGRQASLKALVDGMAQYPVDFSSQPIFLGHGDCLDDAQYVADLIRARFGNPDIRITFIGPVIGAHAGPGILAVFFFGATR